MKAPLQTLRDLGTISQAQFDAGTFYAQTLAQYRATKSNADRTMLENLRAITWTKDEPGHAFRLVVGIAGNAEVWRCVLDASTNDYPRTKRQLSLLREGLQRIADYRANTRKLAA